MFTRVAKAGSPSQLYLPFVANQAAISQSYGVVVFPQWSSAADDAQFAQVRSIGAKVIRVGFSWRLFEPSQGQFDTNTWYGPQVLSFLSKAQSNNLEVVVQFAQVPAWANSNQWCP